MMNSNLYKELNYIHVESQLKNVIKTVEDRISELPYTDFHIIIGRNFLYLETEINIFLNNFYNSAFEHNQKLANKGIFNLFKGNQQTEYVKAIYCRMHRFAINSGLWAFDLYSSSKSIPSNDYSWPADFDFTYSKSFIITSHKDLQTVYKNNIINKKVVDTQLDTASIICDILICLRLLEVIYIVYGSNNKFANIPVFIFENEHDLIFKSVLEDGEFQQSLVINEKNSNIQINVNFSISDIINI
jgi:hypothetical protein